MVFTRSLFFWLTLYFLFNYLKNILTLLQAPGEPNGEMKRSIKPTN